MNIHILFVCRWEDGKLWTHLRTPAEPLHCVVPYMDQVGYTQFEILTSFISKTLIYETQLRCNCYSIYLNVLLLTVWFCSSLTFLNSIWYWNMNNSIISIIPLFYRSSQRLPITRYLCTLSARRTRAQRDRHSPLWWTSLGMTSCGATSSRWSYCPWIGCSYLELIWEPYI